MVICWTLRADSHHHLSSSSLFLSLPLSLLDSRASQSLLLNALLVKVSQNTTSIYLSIYRIYLSIYLSILSIYLPIYLIYLSYLS